MSYEQQYLDQINTILRKGRWVWNERTSTRCLTIPRYVMEIPLDERSAPLLTVRPSYPVSAVAEIIGYLRQYTWATQFDEIGSKTWYVNANETQAWVENPYRKGDNHLGEVYGASLETSYIYDILRKVSDGVDDRGLKLDWWQPHKFSSSALRPCLSDHQFTIIGDELNLTSNQRSCDMMCGGNFNAIQVYFLGMLAAKMSGKVGGSALHIMNHVHIYEEHLGGVEELLSRKPETLNTNFKIKGWVQYPEDILQEGCHAREYFTLKGYERASQPKIDFKLIS